MASDFDPADFVDNDFQAQKSPYAATASLSGMGVTQRTPTPEELSSRVAEAQQKLAEFRRLQEEKERELASLEESRRRRIEFQTGRQEMIQSLTRGVGLLEEAEFTARRDADQMSKTLEDFRSALSKIEVIREETWTEQNCTMELTRALTTIENARMEWNAARLKFAVLTGQNPKSSEVAGTEKRPEQPSLSSLSFLQLCRLGLAFTWPLTVALIALSALFVVLFWRR
jgi:hypothetical protein